MSGPQDIQVQSGKTDPAEIRTRVTRCKDQYATYYELTYKMSAGFLVDSFKYGSVVIII